jgi:hypothetical protein
MVHIMHITFHNGIVTIDIADNDIISINFVARKKIFSKIIQIK